MKRITSQLLGCILTVSAISNIQKVEAVPSGLSDRVFSHNQLPATAKKPVDSSMIMPRLKKAPVKANSKKITPSNRSVKDTAAIATNKPEEADVKVIENEEKRVINVAKPSEEELTGTVTGPINKHQPSVSLLERVVVSEMMDKKNNAKTDSTAKNSKNKNKKAKKTKSSQD